MINNLVVLTSSDEKQVPTKTLDKDLNVINGFPKGMKSFYFDQIEYENFHTALEKVFKLKSCFIVLGKLTELGEFYRETQTEGFRRKKEPKATLQDHDSTEMVLDLDDHVLEGFDPLNPEDAIEYFLQENNINCDVTWQITSSQKLSTKDNPEPLARIRLYFSTHKRFSLRHRKAWSQKFIESDGSVYTCSQPIYTAPPQIVGKDPIKNRTGFIKGKRKTFILPVLTETEITDNSSYSRNSDFNFDDSAIPAEVLSGNVYRRYFMPLAFHYANKGLSENDVLTLIAVKSNQIKSRVFDETNTKEYIRDAFKQISREKESIQTEIVEDTTGKPPEFPKGFIKSLPYPIQMVFENLKNSTSDPIDQMLFPLLISINAFFLSNTFVNGKGRNPNNLFLCLADSASGKDLNTTDIIRHISNSCDSENEIMFKPLLSYSSSATGETAFFENFDQDEKYFWINTEITNVFMQLKNSNGNSSVASLEPSVINIVNGVGVNFKGKSGKKKMVLNDPCCPMIWLGQQKKITENLTISMIDSGLIGRIIPCVVNLNESIEEKLEKIVDSTSVILPKPKKEFYDFYLNDAWIKSGFDTKKTKVLIKKEYSVEMIHSTLRKYKDLMEEDENVTTILSRTLQQIEGINAVLVGMCTVYDNIFDTNYKKEMTGDKLIPFYNYIDDSKVYMIKELINNELDPIYEIIIKSIEKALKNPKGASSYKYVKIIKDKNVVPTPYIKRTIRKSQSFIKSLESSNDKKNVERRLNEYLIMMIKNKELIEIEVEGVVCLGLPKQ